MKDKTTAKEIIQKYGGSSDTKALILLEHEEQVKD